MDDDDGVGDGCASMSNDGGNGGKVLAIVESSSSRQEVGVRSKSCYVVCCFLSW